MSAEFKVLVDEFAGSIQASEPFCGITAYTIKPPTQLSWTPGCDNLGIVAKLASLAQAKESGVVMITVTRSEILVRFEHNVTIPARQAFIERAIEGLEATE